jgi:hypothetical protein
MTREQFIRIIERLNEQNVNIDWMIFSGGEPTLWSHLTWAIKYAKEKGVKHVRVITNGIDREAKDYGDADIIAISHYGGINRLDILHLRKQLGRKRVKIQCVVHLPWSLCKTTKNSSPADCGCTHLTFSGDKAYPCGNTGGRETDVGVSVEEPFYEILMSRNPWMNELCEKCIGNRKRRNPNMPNLTMEFGLWDSSVFSILTFGFKAIWFRKIFRYFTWWI